MRWARQVLLGLLAAALTVTALCLAAADPQQPQRLGRIVTPLGPAQLPTTTEVRHAR